MNVFIRKASAVDARELQSAFDRSAEYLSPWSFPPSNLEEYLLQPHLYLACLTTSKEIIGLFNISQVVRGLFQSAYLGYLAFYPFQGKGYMSQGLELMIQEAFINIKLHRIEANIQPDNFASIRLVSKAGFQKEGFSPSYLRIGGQDWKDHERWAIVNNNWSADNS